MATTTLELLYRDASNYKKMETVYLNGAITQEQIAAVKAAGVPVGYMTDYGLLIPSQLGLPDPYELMEGRYDDDPWWTEIGGWIVDGADENPEWESVTDFVARVQAHTWDIPAAKALAAEIAANR